MTEVVEGFIPHTVVIDPANPTPGSTVSITVTLNGTPKQDQPVDISANPTSFFSSIPHVVTVQAGSNSVQFQATVSGEASGSCVVTASCNGGSAQATCQASGMSGGGG